MACILGGGAAWASGGGGSGACIRNRTKTAYRLPPGRFYSSFFPNLITSRSPPSTSAHLRLFFYTGNEKNLLSPPRRHTRVTKFRHSQSSSSTPSSLAPSTHVLPFPHPIPISFLSLAALLPPPSLLDSKHLKKKKKKKPRQPQTRY